MSLLALALALSPAVQDDPAAAPEGVVVATIPKKYSPFDEREDGERKPLHYVFSPDGSRVAYLATRRDRIYAFTDDDDVGYGDLANKPAFSADGKHVVHAIGKVNRDRSQEWQVYVDGKSVARPDWVGAMTLSKDGETLAYWTQPEYREQRDGESILNRYSLVVAHKKRRKFVEADTQVWEWALPWTVPTIVDDGRRAVGAAWTRDGGILVCVGGREPEVLMGLDTFFSEYTVAKGYDRTATVIRGIREIGDDTVLTTAMWQPFKLYVDGTRVEAEVDAMGAPAFSPNGDHYAFVYHKAGAFGAGIDGHVLDTVEGTICSVLPDDTGSLLAWVVNIDGEADSMNWLTRGLARSITGGRFHVVEAEIERKGDAPVVARELVSDGYAAVERLVRSPVTRRLAFAGLTDKGWFVVQDAKSFGPYESIGHLIWLDDETIGVGTREGQEFRWRKLSIAD